MDANVIMKVLSLNMLKEKGLESQVIILEQIVGEVREVQIVVQQILVQVILEAQILEAQIVEERVLVQQTLILMERQLEQELL